MRRMKGGHTRAASRSWQTGGGMTLIFSSNRTIFKRTLFDEWWIGRTNGRMTKVNHFFLFWWRFYFASAIIPPFYLCVVISPMVWRARPVMNLVPLDHWHNSVLFYFVFSFSFCVLLFIYILLDKRTRIAWEGRERMNGLSLHSSFVSRTLIRQVNSVCVIYDLTGALHWVDWVFFFFPFFYSERLMACGGKGWYWNTKNEHRREGQHNKEASARMVSLCREGMEQLEKQKNRWVVNNTVTPIYINTVRRKKRKLCVRVGSFHKKR